MPALGCTRLGRSRQSSKSGDVSLELTRERATRISLQTAADTDAGNTTFRRSRSLILDTGTDAENTSERTTQLWIHPKTTLDWNRLSDTHVKARIILPDTFNPTRVTFATARERAHNVIGAAV